MFIYIIKKVIKDKLNTTKPNRVEERVLLGGGEAFKPYRAEALN